MDINEFMEQFNRPLYAQSVCNKCDWKTQIYKAEATEIQAVHMKKFNTHNSRRHSMKAQMGTTITTRDAIGRLEDGR